MDETTHLPPEVAAMTEPLDPVERSVLLARLGLDIGTPSSREEMASFLELSPAEVARIEERVTARLRPGPPKEEERSGGLGAP